MAVFLNASNLKYVFGLAERPICLPPLFIVLADRPRISAFLHMKKTYSVRLPPSSSSWGKRKSLSVGEKSKTLR